MFIGVQLSAPTLGGMLSEGLKRLDLCVTDEFDGYVVDHIDIDPTTKFGEGSAFVADVPVSGHGTTSVPAHAVAYSQDVTVHIVQTSDLVPNDAAPTTTLGVPLTITFDLRFDVSGTSTAFTLTYQSVTSLFATRISWPNWTRSSKDICLPRPRRWTWSRSPPGSGWWARRRKPGRV